MEGQSGLGVQGTGRQEACCGPQVSVPGEAVQSDVGLAGFPVVTPVAPAPLALKCSSGTCVWTGRPEQHSVGSTGRTSRITAILVVGAGPSRRRGCSKDSESPPCLELPETVMPTILHYLVE